MSNLTIEDLEKIRDAAYDAYAAAWGVYTAAGAAAYGAWDVYIAARSAADAAYEAALNQKEGI